MEAKKNLKNEQLKQSEQVPTISIKEGSAVDSLDELLADFSEFVRQEDKMGYENQVKLRTKAPNPLRMSPKNKSCPMGLLQGSGNTSNCTTVQTAVNSFSGNPAGIQTPLPLPQTFKPTQQQQNMIMNPSINVQVVISLIKEQAYISAFKELRIISLSAVNRTKNCDIVSLILGIF